MSSDWCVLQAWTGFFETFAGFGLWTDEFQKACTMVHGMWHYNGTIHGNQWSCKITMVHDNQWSCDITMVHDNQWNCDITMVHDNRWNCDITMVHDNQWSCDITKVHDNQWSCDITMVHGRVDFSYTMTCGIIFDLWFSITTTAAFMLANNTVFVVNCVFLYK